ncbi:hypothetical protein FQA47_002709 [Oryzias melastigma]|uniref:Uncharacterized protein n=1 Tax=Oryzias melastigma TaxID=30732 RepID=A0A834F0R2_ORYME|nr:hypothetical protein FQA47_002709 [Oryzias melastigma]
MLSSELTRDSEVNRQTHLTGAAGGGSVGVGKVLTISRNNCTEFQNLQTRPEPDRPKPLVASLVCARGLESLVLLHANLSVWFCSSIGFLLSDVTVTLHRIRSVGSGCSPGRSYPPDPAASLGPVWPARLGSASGRACVSVRGAAHGIMAQESGACCAPGPALRASSEAGKAGSVVGQSSAQRGTKSF